MKRNVEKYDYQVLNDAKNILMEIDMPKELYNPRCVMIFCACAQMIDGKSWRHISEEYMSVHDIIKYVKLKLGKKLNDSIYLSLCDHISTAILRHEEGVDVKNVLLWDIKKFYKDEFEIGKHGLEMIKEKLNVQLNEDEAGFIALHIVNAEMDEKLETIYEVTKVMQEILNIVKYFFHIDFDEDSVYFYRFITHLKFFAARVFDHMEYKDTMQEIYKVMVEQNENAFSGVKKIAEYIKKQYNYKLTIDEQLYLLIHIKRILDEQTK